MTGQAQTGGPEGVPASPRDGGPQVVAAGVVFALVEAGAFVFYLLVARTQWFFADEWEFLSARGLNPGDLLRAHFGHFVAVPIVVYRVLWATVGLRSYLPYVGLAIALHVVASALLWVVMRRARVRPWTATAVASAFVLFGSGAQDVLWAFQITFTSALVLGLLQLLLVDHDGPVDRRDWIGIAAGLLGLMCSGVAVTMVVVVAIAALLRRSWRVALLHSAPIGVYGAWWLHYSHGKYAFTGSARQIFDWCVSGAAGLFDALGSVWGLGWVLAALLVGGSVLALRVSGMRATRRELVLPTALLLGAGAFLVIAAFDRSGVGSSAARLSRYLHILAALTLPALAVAIDALFSRWRAAGAIALAVLLVGIPGNVASARDFARRQRTIDDATRQTMLSIARVPLARDVPAPLRPDPNRAPTLAIGWLLDGVHEGQIPSARASTPREASTNRLRLSLEELDRRSGFPCRSLPAAVDLRLVKGDTFGIVGRVLAISLDPPRSAPVSFGVGLLNPSLAHTLIVTAGPLRVRLVPGAPAGRFGPALCRSPRH